jgi:hypothetical protein
MVRDYYPDMISLSRKFCRRNHLFCIQQFTGHGASMAAADEREFSLEAPRRAS